MDLVERLYAHYQTANREKFEGVLPGDYQIRLNRFLRRLTGRITYPLKLIEIATWHVEQYGFADAIATLEHEMLHLYLHTLGLPSGHNARFKEAARARGIRVFHANPYPKNRAARHRWVLECPRCSRMVFRRRVSGSLACGACCRELADGAWDARFELRLVDKVWIA
jgi:hypothetical protein